MTDAVQAGATFETIAEGVHVLHGGGNPNVAAIEAEDHLVCFDARSTPTLAREWIDRIRTVTDKPIKYLVLSHYHAVRVLGASAYPCQEIIAHAGTERLIAERGREDFDTELARFPHAFGGHEEIPGLTRPTMVFEDRLSLDLGGDRGRFELSYQGRGHTSGDIVGWLTRDRIMFAADLVEKGTVPYTGEAYHQEWIESTLDRLAALEPQQIVAGRGGITRAPADSQQAIADTREFLQMLWDTVRTVRAQGGDRADALAEVKQTMRTTYAHLELAQQDVLAFSTYRCWQEQDGDMHPVIWTPERDRQALEELRAHD